MNGDQESPWRGFLPDHALLMGVEEAAPSLATEGTPDARLWIELGDELSPVARDLLGKMLSAIQLTWEDVFLIFGGVAELQSGSSHGGKTPVVLLRMNHSDNQGLVESPFPQTQCFEADHPEVLIQNPSRKRGTWEVLKRVSAELSMEGPHS